MALPGTRQQMNWFFLAVTPAVRFATNNIPNQQTFENLVSSCAFILNSEDSADVAQTQQGLVLKSVAADILDASDTKDIGIGGQLALSVSPMQLPVIAVTGGTVAVTQNMTTGALLYTLPAYLLASDGDVAITTPSVGQILQYNGMTSKWNNAPIYYQTVKANLTGATQRAAINFSTSFGVADDSTNLVTTITIASNAITYSLMQQTSGGTVLLGNSTGSAGAISEQTIGSGLTLSSGSLKVSTNGITYNLFVAATAGYTLVGNSSASAGNFGQIGLASTLQFTSTNLDIATNGVTYAKFQKSAGNVVLLGNFSGASANYSEILISGLVMNYNTGTGVGTLQSRQGKTVSANTYQVLATDFNGNTIGITHTTTGAVTITMCSPSTVPYGPEIKIKDLAGAAATHNITINPFSGETFDGAANLVISSNYGKTTLFTDGTNWFTA
jgi:hypothetical protein